MASTSKILISPTTAGLFHLNPISAPSADKVSDLLQENHEKHHVFSNSLGIHNHIPHHLLTLYALNTSPDGLEKHYLRNAAMQRSKVLPLTEGSNSGSFGTYSETLDFFSQKIDELGIPAVIQEYVLKEDDAQVVDMLERIYMFHPLISLAFGIEYGQPALVAEGLAMAAVSGKRLGSYLLDAETAARASPSKGKLMEEITKALREDAEIIAVRDAVGPTEREKMSSGPAFDCKVKDKVTEYLSHWKVEASQEVVSRKLAELVSHSARAVACAANHPPNIIKFDFIHIHLLTGWYATFVLCQQPWLSIAQKARLVEYQGRAELGFYLISGVAGAGERGLDNDAYKQYEMRYSVGDEEKNWEDVLRRSTLIEDDGHSSKLIRSLALGRTVSKPYERQSEGFHLSGDDWLRIANMVVDSLQPPLRRWVRFGGYESSWEEFPDRM